MEHPCWKLQLSNPQHALLSTHAGSATFTGQCRVRCKIVAKHHVLSSSLSSAPMLYNVSDDPHIFVRQLRSQAHKVRIFGTVSWRMLVRHSSRERGGRIWGIKPRVNDVEHRHRQAVAASGRIPYPCMPQSLRLRCYLCRSLAAVRTHTRCVQGGQSKQGQRLERNGRTGPDLAAQ